MFLINAIINFLRTLENTCGNFRSPWQILQMLGWFYLKEWREQEGINTASVSYLSRYFHVLLSYSVYTINLTAFIWLRKTRAVGLKSGPSLTEHVHADLATSAKLVSTRNRGVLFFVEELKEEWGRKNEIKELWKKEARLGRERCVWF